MELQLLSFLNSAIDGGEYSASRPGRFTRKKCVPGKRMGGAPEPVWPLGRRDVLPLPGIKPRFLGRPGRRVVAKYNV